MHCIFFYKKKFHSLIHKHVKLFLIQLRKKKEIRYGLVKQTNKKRNYSIDNKNKKKKIHHGRHKLLSLCKNSSHLTGNSVVDVGWNYSILDTFGATNCNVDSRTSNARFLACWNASKSKIIFKYLFESHSFLSSDQTPYINHNYNISLFLKVNIFNHTYQGPH